MFSCFVTRKIAMSLPQENYQVVKFESAMPFFFRLHRRHAENQFRSAMVLEHWHKGLEINYICIGPTDYIVDGVIHHCSAGDVCIINSGSIHSVNKHIKELDDACDAFTIVIDYEFLKSLIPNYDMHMFVVGEKALPMVRAKMQELLECHQRENGPHRHIVLTGMIYELIFLLCESCQKEKDPVELKTQQHIVQICEIMEYVAQHYQEPATQGEIARKMGFSREHFCRYFKQYTGITFLEYVTRYRLNKAREKMEVSTDTALDIALDVGFFSVKQMREAFKKYYGVTPSQYRKSLQTTIYTNMSE